MTFGAFIEQTKNNFSVLLGTGSDGRRLACYVRCVRHVRTDAAANMGSVGIRCLFASGAHRTDDVSVVARSAFLLRLQSVVGERDYIRRRECVRSDGECDDGTGATAGILGHAQLHRRTTRDGG